MHELNEEGSADNVWERIECVRGDLTLEDSDAIVNAANATLRGGGGVDGAIHRAAGPELLAECVRLYPGGCATGEVRATRGFRLRARFVIHAVGPVWQGGGANEAEALAACYERALDCAADMGASSVSFPAISCGVYGYPAQRAAPLALAVIARVLHRHASIRRVRIVLFSAELLAIFDEARRRLAEAR